MSENENPRFPFSNIRAADIAVGFLLSFLVVILTSIILKSGTDLNESDINHLLGNIIFLSILASILLQFRTREFLWSYLYRTPDKNSSWNLLFIVIPLIIISLGYEWFWDFMQLYLVPSYLESRWEWMAENPFVNTEGGIISFLIVFVSAVIIAPIVEEVLFRGVIFDKISNRWNARWGMFVSSLIFGFFHMDPIGAFFFGAVLCMVYLQTRSLLLPILCHAINNFIALLLSYNWPFEIALFHNKEQLYSQAWIGILLAGIGTTWLLWFIAGRYHLLGNTTPSE